MDTFGKVTIESITYREVKIISVNFHFFKFLLFEHLTLYIFFFYHFIQKVVTITTNH